MNMQWAEEEPRLGRASEKLLTKPAAASDELPAASKEHSMQRLSCTLRMHYYDERCATLKGLKKKPGLQAWTAEKEVLKAKGPASGRP